MKRIILSALSIIAVVGMVSAATWARFSDNAVSDNNTFATGTLKMDVLGKNNVTDESFSFVNIKPGDTGGWDGVSWGDNYQDRLEWTVTNTGSLDGTLTVSIQNLVDEYLNDSNVLVVAGAGDPRLSVKIRPQVRVNGTWKTESSGFNNLNPFSVDLPAGQSVNIRIAWSFYEDAGNEYQGAKTTFDVNFDLDQI